MEEQAEEFRKKRLVYTVMVKVKYGFAERKWRRRKQNERSAREQRTQRGKSR